jgi:hypothetical protein
MSANEQNEKLSLMKQDALINIDLEACIPSAQKPCSCSCARNAREADKASTGWRLAMRTLFACWAAMFLMAAILIATGYATLYLAQLLQGVPMTDSEEQQVYIRFAVAAIPAYAMAYYAARGFMFVCGVQQSKSGATYVVSDLWSGAIAIADCRSSAGVARLIKRAVGRGRGRGR